MDKVLVTGLLIIAAGTSVAVIIGSIGPTIGRGGQEAQESQLSAAKKLATSFTIFDVIPNIGDYPPPPAPSVDCRGHGNSCSVDVWMKNIGQADVLPISHMDILMISSTGDWGDYIRFETSCPASTTTNCWSYIPPNQDPASRDMIMVPNETLHI